MSVLAKQLLSRQHAELPPALRDAVPAADVVRVQAIRDVTNARRLAQIRQLCANHVCDFAQQEPRFGLTPLHIAAMSADKPLMQFLYRGGAHARFDTARRLPRNLTFDHFIANSKKWAALARRDDCDLPVVVYDGSQSARDEVRRLVTEGEPLLMRGAFSYYSDLNTWSVERVVRQFAQTDVTVGHVPYADAFNLSTMQMKLVQYYESYMEGSSAQPYYVFNKNDDVCQRGYDVLKQLVLDAFPTPQLIASPDDAGGLDSIHFFLGQKDSGAPFHIHADAVNAAVTGLKQWYIYTPARTLYSRKTIKKWVEEDLKELPMDERPLECLQRPGDVVYVPLDWGHAVLNLEDKTFGYALEVLNKRDTLSHIWR